MENGKPLLPKEPKEQLPPMNEGFLLSALLRTSPVPQTLHLLNSKMLNFLLSSLTWFPKPQLQPLTLEPHPVTLHRVTKNLTMPRINSLTV